MTLQLCHRFLVASDFAADYNQMCFTCTLSNKTVLKALQDMNKIPCDVVAGSGEENGCYLEKWEKNHMVFQYSLTLRTELATESSVCLSCDPNRSPPSSCLGLPQSWPTSPGTGSADPIPTGVSPPIVSWNNWIDRNYAYFSKPYT